MIRESSLVASYVRELGLLGEKVDAPVHLQHIGAILADTILQAGLNYRTVVKPRVLRVLNRFPEAETTGGLISLINCIGAGELLKWRHPEKPARFVEFATFLQNNYLDNVGELRDWLADGTNCVRLMEIRGIGEKSVDYLKILVGLETVAVDRHIKVFLNNAGVKKNNYYEIQGIFIDAAFELATAPSTLDAAIWNYLSSGTLR